MTREDKRAALLLTATAMLGALLLFSSELIVGRIVTPLYGGASSVWLLCLMLYQVLLLLGYAYAHLLGRKLGRYHLLIALLPTLNLPLNMRTSFSLEGSPSAEVLINLCVHIALPFIVLSTTAVITQLYWQRSSLGKQQAPWKLYAASNTGSLIALLGYPTLIEPWVSLTTQRYVWSALWLLYIALLAASYFVAKPLLSEKDDQAPSSPSPPSSPTPGLMQQARWLVLSAIPSAMLVVVSSVMSAEVGSFPMLWTAPLTLYILTFILIFSDNHPRLRSLFINAWPEIATLGFALWLLMIYKWIGIALMLLFLFALCASNHGKLYEERPEPEHLTRFYLMMSLGGGIGGAAATMLPPILFNSFAELPITLAAFTLTMLYMTRAAAKRFLKEAPITKVAPRLFVILTALALSTFTHFNSYEPQSLEVTRNFYGIFRVADAAETLPDGTKLTVRKLYHGRTIHGMQTPNGELASPLAYYHLDGAMGQVYKLVQGQRDIAAIGLGSGAMAAHAREGDTLKFFEIDPNSVYLAKKWFTFIKDSKAESITFAVGDGRTLLAQDPKKYDIVHVDAFSGDGIPSHLLTVEAMQLYLDHLEDDGVILLHVSNRYYELRPLLKKLAEHLNVQAYYNHTDPDIPAVGDLAKPTFLVALSRTNARLDALLSTGHWGDLRKLANISEVTLWTDERIDLPGALGFRLNFPSHHNLPSQEPTP